MASVLTYESLPCLVPCLYHVSLSVLEKCRAAPAPANLGLGILNRNVSRFNKLRVLLTPSTAHRLRLDLKRKYRTDRRIRQELERFGFQELIVARMDSMEPEQTPFAAVSAQTSKFSRVSWRDGPHDPAWYTSENAADKEVSNIKRGWINQRRTRRTDGWAHLHSWYFSSWEYSSRKDGISVGCLELQFWLDFSDTYLVAYSLGIYLLNLFLAFLQPKFDPSNEAVDNEMEDGAAGGLPTKQDEEFRPFIRRLPEFKFWHSATRAISIGFFCTWFTIFDVPVFWPVLVVYWLILFTLTSKSGQRSDIASCWKAFWLCTSH